MFVANVKGQLSAGLKIQVAKDLVDYTREAYGYKTGKEKHAPPKLACSSRKHPKGYQV
jgi:hypothetical protein